MSVCVWVFVRVCMHAYVFLTFSGRYPGPILSFSCFNAPLHPKQAHANVVHVSAAEICGIDILEKVCSGKSVFLCGARYSGRTTHLYWTWNALQTRGFVPL